MARIKVKDSNSLYRDEDSGAILNCNDTAYDNYLKMKQNKLNEVDEMDKLKDDVDELKDMMKLIMSCDSIDKLLSLDYQIALIQIHLKFLN